MCEQNIDEKVTAASLKQLAYLHNHKMIKDRKNVCFGQSNKYHRKQIFYPWSVWATKNYMFRCELSVLETKIYVLQKLRKR